MVKKVIIFSPKKSIKRKGRHSKKDKNKYRGQGKK
jgi:hypothetical protein